MKPKYRYYLMKRTDTALFRIWYDDVDSEQTMPSNIHMVWAFREVNYRMGKLRDVSQSRLPRLARLYYALTQYKKPFQKRAKPVIHKEWYWLRIFLVIVCYDIEISQKPPSKQASDKIISRKYCEARQLAAKNAENAEICRYRKS